MVLKHTLSTKRYMRQYETEIRTRRRDTKVSHGRCKANLPKDVVLGVPILTLTGHYEVNIENYRGILEYTEQLIRINVRSGQIRITGKSLEINYYTTTDMKITGKVEKIEYS